MSDDALLAQLPLAERDVRAAESDGGAHEIALTRSLAASPVEAWAALTSPRRFARWYPSTLAGELHEGGWYELHGRRAGEILACVRPSHLRVTWGGRASPSIISITLVEDGPASTRLSLRHAMEDPQGLWALTGPAHFGSGWDIALARLALHVERGWTFERDDIEEWLHSDAGRAFARASCERWAHAAITAGGANEWAESSAGRTLRFLTESACRMPLAAPGDLAAGGS